MTSNQFDQIPNAVPLQASNKIKSASEQFVSGSKMGRSRLGGDYQPSEYSVICGRVKESFNHVGNCRFRILTTCYLESYSREVVRTAKSAIVSDIVALIRQSGGNFCKYEKGAWFEVGDRYAREKVCTLLRDLLRTQYQSSVNKAKLAHQRARKIDKKQKQQYNQQLVQGTDDFSTASTLSSSSSCWGRSMDSLGGEALPDDVFFDIDFIF
jgi:hypothetical protein